MKRMLTTAAVSLAIATGALTMAQAEDKADKDDNGKMASSDCEVVSPELNQRLMEEPERRQEFSPQLSRDLRYMRNVAIRLERYGKTEACDAIAKAMKEITDEPGEYREAAAQSQLDGGTGTGMDDADLGWDERREMRREAAVPVDELDRRLRAGDLIGADVHGTDDDSIGEVDDLVLGHDEEDSYVIVAYGGFLGFGQDLSAVPLDRVRVTPDLNTVYVPLDRDQLEDAPTFSRGDFDEMNDRDWQKRNKEFYSKAD